MSQPYATIVMPVFNEARHIEQCITAILGQTVSHWELLIVDDNSVDDTERIVSEFADDRIIYIKNTENRGGAAARNRGLEAARADYIFFTDGDCVVSEDWLETGLRLFHGNRYAGLEGRLIFVDEGYTPVYSDRVVECLNGGQYMTANMAYRRSVLFEAGLFNPALRRYSDRDLGLRVKKHGEITFVPEMVVRHAQVKWTPRTYFNYAKAVRYSVLMYKASRAEARGHRIFWRVYAPEKLLAIVFPPLVLGVLLKYRFASVQDYLLLFLLYPRLVYERVLLWKYCVQEHVFLV